MSIIYLKEQLHQYIDNADEAKLEEIYKIIEDKSLPYKYSAEDIAMFNERREAYLTGEGKNYTIEESINLIRKK